MASGCRGGLGEPRQALLGGADLGLEAERCEGVHEVLAYGTVALELRCLLMQPDAPAASPCDGARVGVLDAGDEAQQRRLAAAVAPDQHGVVAGVDGERGGGEQALAAERLVDVVKGHDAHGGASGRGRGPRRKRQDTIAGVMPPAGPRAATPGLPPPQLPRPPPRPGTPGAAAAQSLRCDGRATGDDAQRSGIVLGPRTTVHALLAVFPGPGALLPGTAASSSGWRTAVGGYVGEGDDPGDVALAMDVTWRRLVRDVAAQVAWDTGRPRHRRRPDYARRG